MPPAEVAPPAGGERLDGERFSTRAAEAMVAEVGDGGQLATGLHACFHVAARGVWRFCVSLF